MRNDHLLGLHAETERRVLLRLRLIRLDEVGQERATLRKVGVLSNHGRLLLPMLDIRTTRYLRPILLQHHVLIDRVQILGLRVHRNG